MTNTNDFRKYSFASDTSYLINQFDIRRSTNTQAAPKLEPEAERGFKVRENKKRKSITQLRAEQKSSFLRMLVIVAISVVCIAMVGMVINSFAVKNELTKELAAKQVDIANAQSENVGLQSKLDALVSISMIDDYAVSNLGMTKVKSNQIQYMDVSEYKAQRLDEVKTKSPADLAEALSNK